MAGNTAQSAVIRQGGANTTVIISGTRGSDAFEFITGATQQSIKVNDRVFSVPSADVASYRLDGLGGNDTVHIVGTGANEMAVFHAMSTVFQMPDYTLQGITYTVTAVNIEQVQVEGGGGYDKAYFYDSPGNDLLELGAKDATMKLWSSGDIWDQALDFDWVRAISNSGGHDSKLLKSPLELVFETEGNWLDL